MALGRGANAKWATPLLNVAHSTRRRADIHQAFLLLTCSLHLLAVCPEVLLGALSFSNAARKLALYEKRASTGTVQLLNPHDCPGSKLPT
jgi:hypothetical protein